MRYLVGLSIIALTPSLHAQESLIPGGSTAFVVPGYRFARVQPSPFSSIRAPDPAKPPVKKQVLEPIVNKFEVIPEVLQAQYQQAARTAEPVAVPAAPKPILAARVPAAVASRPVPAAEPSTGGHRLMRHGTIWRPWSEWKAN